MTHTVVAMHAEAETCLIVESVKECAPVPPPAARWLFCPWLHQMMLCMYFADQSMCMPTSTNVNDDKRSGEHSVYLG